MDESVASNKKSNIIVDFAKAWLYIFYYALIGLRFILFDMWRSMFHKTSNVVDGVYQKVAQKTEKELGIDLYEKTKMQHVKVKVIKHSEKEMKKYQEMKEKLQLDLQNAGATRSKTPVIYKYTVMDKDGKIFSDIMSGFSKLDVQAFLLNEGYEVFAIDNNKTIDFAYSESGIFARKMSTKDLVFILTQLSTYIKAGITLIQAVKIITSQVGKNKSQQRVFQAISYELMLGEAFSTALEKQGNYFPPLLINMMKAAEATGTLQETLDDMANYYTEINKTKKEMKSALTYPAFITVFAIAVLTFIIIWVVPQFTKVYEQSGLEITGMTKFIVNLSHFLQNNIILVVGGVLAVLFGLYLLYHYVKGFRVAIQLLLMHIPVVKNVIIYNELTIFSKTFASLLKNNVFITDSVGILSKITSNEIYRAVMYKTINNIENGEKISDAFKDHWAIPEVAYYMIVTGESTGELADMMAKVADFYQQEHRNVVSSLKSVIEPVMIIFLAIMVGIIVISVIVPMFSLYNGIM